MRNGINIIDTYFKQMEKKCACKLSDELIGTKYSISKNIGKGTIKRIIIDEGLEIAHWDNSATMEWSFNNEKYGANIIEISYCYKGKVEIETFPNKKKYFLENGDMAFYRMQNYIEKFKFSYEDFGAVSMHIDLNKIKGSLNPIWGAKVILEWEELIDNIYSKDILNIEKAPYNIKLAAKEIRDMKIVNMMDYIKIKFKALELFMLCLQFKVGRNYNIDNFTKEEVDIIYRAESIILENLQEPPSLQGLSKDLNITIYKLQKGFKEIMGSTVYEYIRRARVERSKILLKDTDIPIICIANKIGYENPSKFSNAFKSYTNMTPTEYRNKKYRE
ncbi:helix-turn-helix domain-containing protein [Tissierella praeacuta]|uniref:helix-turn-helix domain-containing protein n=1 Tax=Tissierella praeacuta TaxID=43131 RepID=UPI001C0FD75F|nr:AraC family transcriptional regulator [Tissierella praeacuta]MBU5256289.1 AraC family transcriptional regulator [Tissierella praeacuta]